MVESSNERAMRLRRQARSAAARWMVHRTQCVVCGVPCRAVDSLCSIGRPLRMAAEAAAELSKRFPPVL